jgi:exodeoxyribonuclease V beta subunit
MSELPSPLDPLTLPLQGSQLIEASAGTGKTWTIAALYLRLVLGHGSAPRLPAQILVMTFTKAATRELSDRIRGRLLQAAAVFRSEAVDEPDPFLADLLAAFAPGPERQQAAWRLAMAAEAMDDAAVFTIDAWCQRMLREHAFDSGCLFDEELQANEEALRAEALRDWWRQQVYPLDDDTLAAVLALWPDVDALARSLKRLLDGPFPPAAGQGTLADALALARQTRADALVALKAGWDTRADAMQDWLVPIWRDKQHPARSAVPAKGHASRWIDALRAWATDPTIEQPDVKKGAERLSASALLQGLGSAAVALPSCFSDFETLMADLQHLPQAASTLRWHAATQVAARFQQLKAQTGHFGFADMLNRLDAALDPERQGDKAGRLREHILAQYPAALIDEFQDTSPVQLRIFDRLYRIADNEPSRALLLIGDPKQAIYSFRGADIHSYLRARQATAGRHHVLDTNHRSTQALVCAVNAMFEAAEARTGDGAFLFRQADGASPLPFVGVGAKGRPERLVGPRGDLPAATLVLDQTLRHGDANRTLFAALCAERIVRLLNDPQVGFEQAGQPFKRLQPAHIAVLVRNYREAAAVRDAMRRRGLASVYLSDRDSVFQTAEADDLLRLLQAVAAPRDMRLARAALATRLLDFPLPSLVALAGDDEAFDRQCERLQELNAVWRGQGVLAMVRRALHLFDLPARWLGTADAAGQCERRLTNVLHLAELLQAASAELEGEQALVHWLAQQIADTDAGLGGGEERVLRLESDADLVQVVTVHKSKGLEYPLVFLPFAAHFRAAVPANTSPKSALLRLPGSHTTSGEPEPVLAPTAAQIEVAEQERLREDLRLLYVALTRARHSLWVGLAGLQIGVGKVYGWHRSAIGCLLSGPAPQAPEQRPRDVQALDASCADIVVEPLPGADDDALPLPAVTPLATRGMPAPLAPPPVYAATFDRAWSISSYSALVRDAGRGALASGAILARVRRDDEPVDGQNPTARPAAQPWHRFPRGAVAGNFLHDQLEWLAGEQFALDSSAALQQRLLRRCERQGWGHRADDVLAWLRQLCTTPLPVPGTALCGLRSVAPEMEFWFPSDGLRAQRVDALCCEHLQPGRARPLLPERTLKGLLMGFADLVFEYQGRWWVLDYKSNALGAQDSDYTPQAMDAAMLAHRYDVQATLYLLALHRLLKARLGAVYVPAQHLGGAIYFFLRGVSSASAGCCAMPAPLALIEAIDAMLPASPPAPGKEGA